MKLTLLILTALLFVNTIIGQTVDGILVEADLFYNFEMASWNGAGIFLENFPENQQILGGYIFCTKVNLHNCIFFDKPNNQKCVGKDYFQGRFGYGTKSNPIHYPEHKIATLDKLKKSVFKKAFTGELKRNNL